MAPRSLASAMISFGLVSIQVRIFPAAVSRHVRFHLLHAKCGNRIRYQAWCPVEEVVVPPEQIVKGYEIAKGDFVQMTAAELESLEGEASREIRIAEFVPLAAVDPVQFDRSYYLGPDRGGARPFGLLHDALAESGKAAVGRFVLRGKESLVLIRAATAPSPPALLLHTMYFHDEVRDLGELDLGHGKARPAERALAVRLIDELTKQRFDAGDFEDEHRARVLAFVRAKAKGKERALPEVPREKRAKVVDLMDALRRSLDAGGQRAGQGRSARHGAAGHEGARRAGPRRAGDVRRLVAPRPRRGRAPAARARQSA